MRIFYITHTRFPTEKAHGWQIAKMCEALTVLGHQVTLVVPGRRTGIAEPAENYYNLRRGFEIIRLPITDALAAAWLPRLPAFLLSNWSFRRGVARWATKTELTGAVLLTRDHALISVLAGRGQALVYEAHDIPQSLLIRGRRIAELTELIVVTNSWKRETIAAAWGEAVKEKIIVLPNAVDLDPYRSLPDTQAARRELGLPLAEKLAVYGGHLYAWKGVYTLARAAALLPGGMRVLMVGGTDKDLRVMAGFLKDQRISAVTLVGHVPPARFPLYLAAADCLVLPNSGRDWNSRYTTSPIKLWEYLAARRPVVASDLPSIRELVTEQEVRFVTPDDPAALAAALKEAVAGDEARVDAGLRRVQGQTWEARAKKLIEAISYGRSI
ncbi:glycosyltransferase [Patescibacteria group bacterium]|nr:MAG: glycosyltransferase [Patescibacteria group bacterium]